MIFFHLIHLSLFYAFPFHRFMYVYMSVCLSVCLSLTLLLFLSLSFHYKGIFPYLLPPTPLHHLVIHYFTTIISFSHISVTLSRSTFLPSPHPTLPLSPSFSPSLSHHYHHHLYINPSPWLCLGFSSFSSQTFSPFALH